MHFLGEPEQKMQKQFFDLLRIPGCFFMLLHCAVMKFGASSITAGLSDWITTQVSINYKELRRHLAPPSSNIVILIY